ncbi:MAG: hypothetical protein ACOX1F_04970 [Erysipelotrichaceae bacterium]|jgi:hypothetical protein
MKKILVILFISMLFITVTGCKQKDTYPDVKIGDIVYYDPTVGAAEDQLKYVSEKGYSITDGYNNSTGNGYGNQEFLATEADNKWIVIGKKDNHIILMSYDVKLSTKNEGLYIKGATAFLFAEQELHNICSIYGHGKGATKNPLYPVKPKIGAPGFDEKDAPDLIESGARSITLEDMEEMTGIKSKEQKEKATRYGAEKSNNMNWYNNQYKDFFMKSERPKEDIIIPTLTNHVMGKPLFTFYNIRKDDPQIKQALLEYLFNGDYWVAGKMVFSNDEKADFMIPIVNVLGLNTSVLFEANSDMVVDWIAYSKIRPIVVIETGVELIPADKEGFIWIVNQE